MWTYTTHTTLLARLADRDDSAAWYDFRQRYGELVLSLAARHQLQPADREDCLQDVMLSLSRAMPGFHYDPAKGKFRSYLKTVSLHAVYRKLREKHRSEALEGDGGDIEGLVSTDEVESVWETEWRRYHLRQATRRLESEIKDRDRAVLAQYVIAGRGADDTAESVGVPVDEVYRIKSRLLKRLGQLIAEQVEEEG